MDNSYKFDDNFKRCFSLADIIDYLERFSAGYEIKAFKSCTLLTLTYVDTYDNRRILDEYLRGFKPVKTWKAPYQRKKEGVV